MNRPNPQQAAALVEFIDRAGHDWKQQLSTCWQRAAYPHTYGLQPGTPSLLQQVRNQCGPSWLRKTTEKQIRAGAQEVSDGRAE